VHGTADLNTAGSGTIRDSSDVVQYAPMREAGARSEPRVVESYGRDQRRKCGDVKCANNPVGEATTRRGLVNG
jgi:hypothetical protein